MSHRKDAFKASSNNIAKVVFRTCLKALTSGRDYKLTSWQDSEFAQSHRLIAAVLAQKVIKKGWRFVHNRRVVVAIEVHVAHKKGAELPSLETRPQPTI